MIYISDVPKPFHEGMTLADAFRENGISLKGPFIIYVNLDVVDYSEYETFELHDGDEIEKMYMCVAGE